MTWVQVRYGQPTAEELAAVLVVLALTDVDAEPPPPRSRADRLRRPLRRGVRKREGWS